MIPRLYLDHRIAADVAIPLSQDQLHYLSSVMRRGDNAELLLFNGRDGEWRARFAPEGKRAGAAFPIEQRRTQQPTEADLWLLFAPLKRGPVDLIAQKATELGASRLLPTVTAHSQADRINSDRLNRIAIEAAEQCERLSLPEIDAPKPLADRLADWPEERALIVCAEAGEAKPIAQALKGLKGRPAAILTGPEGGFGTAELDLLAGLAFTHPVSLGPRILKAETAALAALACFQALAGDGEQERAGFPRR